MYAAVERLFLELPEQTLARMFDFLTPADVVTLAKTSRPLRSVAQFYMGRVWDFHLFFEAWFPGKTEVFRDLLDHTGAVVSGSQALQFFERSKYPGSDLDIFVRAGGFFPFTTFLAGQGYSPFIPTPSKLNRYGGRSFETKSALATSCIKNMQADRRPMIAVYNYRRTSSSNAGVGGVVQVVIVEGDPIHHILYDFHSTGVMNFISAQEAVSVFAKLTLVDRVSYVTNPRMTHKEPTWVEKYKSRGFRMVCADTQEAQYHGMIDRYVGDEECFRLRFPVPPSSPETMAVRDKIYGDLHKNFRFTISSKPAVWRGSNVAVVGFLTITFV